MISMTAPEFVLLSCLLIETGMSPFDATRALAGAFPSVKLDHLDSVSEQPSSTLAECDFWAASVLKNQHPIFKISFSLLAEASLSGSLDLPHLKELAYFYLREEGSSQELGEPETREKFLELLSSALGELTMNSDQRLEFERLAKLSEQNI